MELRFIGSVEFIVFLGFNPINPINPRNPRNQENFSFPYALGSMLLDVGL
jgi:hypothetical protein